MISKLKCVTFLFVLVVVNAQREEIDDDKYFHPRFKDDDDQAKYMKINKNEEQMEYWKSRALSRVANKLKIEHNRNENTAKNIIMFLGDGMSLPTVAATRVYLGAEEVPLSFEKFPHTGLSKTYCVDKQVADSACSATAYLHGVKSNFGTIGVNAKVPRFDCKGVLDKSTHTESITKWAQAQGKATGFVTTSRVTHASPAGIFAHIANRNWEWDTKVIENNCDPKETIDIARQLVEWDIGRKLKVILGGGRMAFRNRTITDEEGRIGLRSDGKDLIDEWITERNQHSKASYVWNKKQLNAIDIEKTDYLLGLFESNHCMYNLDITDENKHMEPRLSEMTEVALKFLQKEKQGYFLFVEGARIDLAHHDTWARKALDETAEFSKTIEMVKQMTNESDTLIVVTADHGHTMSYNGYAFRGSDVLGLSRSKGSDNLPYSTLSYANGRGYFNTYDEKAKRKDISVLDFSNPELEYMSTVPMDYGTHGGEDVGIYASGPHSHIFVGNYEQNNIPYLMAYASKLGPYSSASAITTEISFILLLLLMFRSLLI